MPTRFTLRMQFGLHADAHLIASSLVELVRRAPVDEIMFFFFAEDLNDGHETLDQVKQWIEHSRVYRKAVVEEGVAQSLNPWHTLLHCDRSRRLKPGQDWQTLVDQNGLAASTCVCPLDEKWRDYYRETLKLYAKEGFRVIWIDDDFRFHNHQPLDGGGCFCPLHVAEFNRRAATKATREEIVRAVTAPGEPHPWRKLWLDLWDETMCEFLTTCRQIVEAGGSRLGLMSSEMGAHAAEGRRWAEWWKAIGGGKPPFHRPHYCSYSDALGKDLPNSIAMLDQNRTVQPERVESGPEIDIDEYGPWNKSYRQIGAQMALAQVSGSTHLNLSLYDFLGNQPLDEPERMEFLRAWRPTCTWLADEFPMSMRSHGVGLPWSEEMGRKVHAESAEAAEGAEGGDFWRSLTVRSRGWATWLGGTGHAFSMRPSETVNALGGRVVWALSDDQLRSWLSKGMLIDGAAARILVERGFGPLIGFKSGRMITRDDALYAVEQCLDAKFAVRAGAQMSVNRGGYCERMFQGELVTGARAVSDLRGPRQNIVGHGLVLFENELGGRVAVVPWSVDGGWSLTTYRATQLTRTLDWLDPQRTHGRVEGGAWLVPQFLTDGVRFRGVVWNASPDALMEIVVIRPPTFPEFRRAVQIDARGTLNEVVVAAGHLHLAKPLMEWEFVVLM